MKKIVAAFCLVLSCFISFSLTNNSPQNEPVSGTWKGTSICQVKDSPCHDEIAIYHAAKGADGKSYHFQMNKMVNGKEEEMGPLDFTFDQAKQTLTGVTNSDRGKGIWVFKLNGKAMHGTLTVDNVLYRVIELQKAN